MLPTAQDGLHCRRCVAIYGLNYRAHHRLRIGLLAALLDSGQVRRKPPTVKSRVHRVATELRRWLIGGYLFLADPRCALCPRCRASARAVDEVAGGARHAGDQSAPATRAVRRRVLRSWVHSQTITNRRRCVQHIGALVSGPARLVRALSDDGFTNAVVGRDVDRECSRRTKIGRRERRVCRRSPGRALRRSHRRDQWRARAPHRRDVLPLDLRASARLTTRPSALLQQLRGRAVHLRGLQPHGGRDGLHAIRGAMRRVFAHIRIPTQSFGTASWWAPDHDRRDAERSLRGSSAASRHRDGRDRRVDGGEAAMSVRRLADSQPASFAFTTPTSPGRSGRSRSTREARRPRR